MHKPKNIIGWQKKFVLAMVYIRTSFAYMWIFLAMSFSWVVLNKTGLVHWDNQDLSYMNIVLSIMAELSSLVLLVYTLRIAEGNDRAEKTLANELAELKKLVQELHTLHKEDK